MEDELGLELWNTEKIPTILDGIFFLERWRIFDGDLLVYHIVIWDHVLSGVFFFKLQLCTGQGFQMTTFFQLEKLWMRKFRL